MNLSNSSSRSGFEQFQAALNRLGGDRQLLCDLATIFIEDAPELLKTLEREIESRDYDSAASTAHRLKGLVVTFDDRAGLLLQQLIDAAKQGDVEQVQSLHATTVAETRRLLESTGRLAEEC